MINGLHPGNPEPRLGEREYGFILDKCHMNIYRYLSAWIHYASLLITKFSLSYEEAIGLVIGMYCDNNPLCFVLVAKDLLARVDAITGISSTNFGLMVRVKMDEKREEIRTLYGGEGFTFPQRFQNCWQDGWKKRMNNKSNFEKEQRNVAAWCATCL